MGQKFLVLLFLRYFSAILIANAQQKTKNKPNGEPEESDELLT